jgi:hypothetical protein
MRLLALVALLSATALCAALETHCPESLLQSVVFSEEGELEVCNLSLARAASAVDVLIWISLGLHDAWGTGIGND